MIAKKNNSMPNSAFRLTRHMTKGAFFAPTPTLAALGGLVILTTGLALHTKARQGIPPDPQPTTSIVPAATFATWFQSGMPTLDGVVKPANSITFPDNPGLKNVDFYQWSEQMFLWLTSPAPATYGGGGGRIFNSPVFYDVSPPDAMGNRTLLKHTVGRGLASISNFSVRAAQKGFHNLPIIMSKSGRMFEVEKPQLAPGGKLLVQRTTGGTAIAEKAALNADRKLIFLDKANKPIPNTKLMFKAKAANNMIAQKVMINNKILFFDIFGNPIDTEEGQAADGGSGTLLTQGGSLIYYITMVNDVYAYFLTGTKDGGISPTPTKFPTTQADLNKITAFATLHNKTFVDPEALAIEVKSSWVDASTLPNPTDYITINGTVPVYNKSNPKHWIATGAKQTIKLAMIGCHVVGSTKGHPEMIWSSFEHVGNTPNADYKYNSVPGPNPADVPQDTNGTWLFCASGANGPSAHFNQQIQSASGADIVSDGAAPIGPTNIIRFKPFGAAVNSIPNPLITSVAASNSQVMSMNNSVRGQLIPGDIRGNYFFLGATWTIAGAAPSGASPSGNVVGTSQLANSTMETFQVLNSNFDQFNNCFGCHQTNQTTVSHIFPGIKKLF